MYARQKGLLPAITYVGGFFLFAYFSLVAFINIIRFVGDDMSRVRLVNLVALIGAGLPIALVGLGIAGLFPEIHLVKEGIRYRYMSLFAGIVKWEDIEEIVKTNRLGGCIVIVTRKASLFRWFHGAFIRYERPVMLLHPGLEGREGIVAEIGKQTNLRVVGGSGTSL